MNSGTKHEMQAFNNPLFGDVEKFMIDEVPSSAGKKKER